MVRQDQEAEDRSAAVAMPVEVYTPERKAQFLLSNAVDAEDYAAACDEVRAMGLDPKEIPHYKPAGEFFRTRG